MSLYKLSLVIRRRLAIRWYHEAVLLLQSTNSKTYRSIRLDASPEAVIVENRASSPSNMNEQVNGGRPNSAPWMNKMSNPDGSNETCDFEESVADRLDCRCAKWSPVTLTSICCVQVLDDTKAQALLSAVETPR
nr:hypothetical protein CFP56_02809 [Quercus suber]